MSNYKLNINEIKEYSQRGLIGFESIHGGIITPPKYKFVKKKFIDFFIVSDKNDLNEFLVDAYGIEYRIDFLKVHKDIYVDFALFKDRPVVRAITQIYDIEQDGELSIDELRDRVKDYFSGNKLNNYLRVFNTIEKRHHRYIEAKKKVISNIDDFIEKVKTGFYDIEGIPSDRNTHHMILNELKLHIK